MQPSMLSWLVVDICTSAKTQPSNKTELQTTNINKNKRDTLTTQWKIELQHKLKNMQFNYVLHSILLVVKLTQQFEDHVLGCDPLKSLVLQVTILT
jgi:hypothetical protein